MNETIEILRHELKANADEAPQGAQAEVAEKIGYSREYVFKIIKGDALKPDTEANRALLRKMIKLYRKINNDKLNRLKKLKVNEPKKL